jgi:hypothetical protein
MAVGAAAEFDFLEAAATRSIDDLRRAVHAVPAEPDGRGAQFLRVVDATLDALDARVGNRRVAFEAARDTAEQELAIRNMQMTNLDVLTFHSYTPWIESSRNSTLGIGLIYLIKEMVADLLKDSADVVVTPSTDYMYETTYRPFAQALTRLGGTYPPGAPPIVVAYPVQESESLFLHLIIAHELGHSVVTEADLTETVRNSASTTARKLLSDAVTEYEAIEHVRTAVAVAEVSVILGNWITEILCDGIALGLLGPSFVLTAATFDPPFGGPRPSDTHPPSSLRTRFLLERLKSWGWRPILDAAVGSNILSWIDQRASVPQEVGGKDYFITLERALEELASKIEEEVVNHLGAARFVPDHYLDAEERPAKELLDLLDHRVLPVQTADGSPATSSAIVLAGWFYSLSHVADEPDSLVAVINDREFQRFLTKSLEMCAILEHWRRPA